MSSTINGVSLTLAAIAVYCAAVPCLAAGGDFDGNGYVDLSDYEAFRTCFTSSGPATPPGPSDCLPAFDFDADGDVDLKDYAAFSESLGHLPIPLRDGQGNVLAVGATTPYSGRRTCGATNCHDVDTIANAYHFQQGRTDQAGNIIVQDDYFGDGRFFVRSPGMYGKW